MEAVITKDCLPEADYECYHKTYAPRAIRMAGTFHCLTSEGNLVSCTDGWLVIDSRGFPYPVNAAEFESTYVLADHR